MKAKKEFVAFTVIIIALVVAIGFTVLSILGSKSKEINVAKELVTKLQKMDVIDTELDVEEIEFNSVAKVASKNSKNQYTVVAENIGIDLDSEYNVTGFSNKLKEKKYSDVFINESEAVRLSEKYVDEIANEIFGFKEVKSIKEGEENTETYAIAFYKYYKGYPYYDNEIVVNINKASGKLEGYTNQSIDVVKHNYGKDIDLEEAKSSAIEYFNKLNIKAEIVGEPILAFTLGISGEFELSYVVDLTTIDSDRETDKYKLVINAESGEVVSRTNDLIDASRSN